MTTIAIPYEPLLSLGFQRIMQGSGWKYTPEEPKQEEIRDTTGLIESEQKTLADYLGKVRHGCSIVVRKVKDTLYVPHRFTERGKVLYAENAEQKDAVETEQLPDEVLYLLKRPERIEIAPELRRDFLSIARSPLEDFIEPFLEKVYDKIRKYKEPMRTTLELEFDCAAMARSTGQPEKYISP